MRNSLPRPGKTESPLSKFTGTSVQPNLKHFHPFGCPVYVLQAPLQTRNPFSKWGERSRIGIFLCHSPHHASSVPLILSTQTGLVSSQFHCVFDDNFDTVKREQADTSLWKIKAHLQEAKEQAAEVTTQSSLISGPNHQPATSLRPYSRDIPQALPDLSQLLPDVPATTEGDRVPDPPVQPTEEPTSPVAAELPDPVPDQVGRHQQESSPNQPTQLPVIIAPTGYSRTGRPIRRPARFAYAAYHCKHLAQTGIQSVLDFHPFASLRAFASTIAQPDVIQMQCPSMWHCNNQTVTSSSMPWHASWSSTRNSSIGRSFTSPKSCGMSNRSLWYGLSDAKGIQQARS